jgi:hypothetical protein
MKLKTAALTFITLSACQLIQADDTKPNLFKNGDFETGKIENFSAKQVNLAITSQEEAYESNHAMSLTFPVDGKNRDVLSGELIPVDPDKEYTLSLMLKSGGQAESQEVYVGLACYTEEEKLIISQAINRLENTETELLADAVPGDTVLKVKKADQWKSSPNSFVAFNVDDSPAVSDLPNFNLSPMGIQSVTEKGGAWEIELVKAMTKSYPAGTKIRQHNAGNSYVFCTVANKTIPKNWKEFSGKITGKSDRLSNKQFWPGTRFVQVAILPGKGANERLLVDNIKLEEFVP